MGFEKTEHNTRDALRPLTALCPVKGCSKSSLALANLSLLALGKDRACGCCWKWHPEERGKGFGYPEVINYQQPVSIHWTAFSPQINYESPNQKKFWTVRVRSRCESCISCSLFDDTNGDGCCQSALPSSLYLQREGNLLARFPSDFLTESQDRKEAELLLKHFAFEILGVSASLCSQRYSWSEGSEADKLSHSQCHIWSFPHHSIFSFRF